jgi:hypothetical protein
MGSSFVGLDSYSDVTVAHREIAYNIHRVAETVQTGAGEATYQEEGLVDIVDGLYSFRTVLARIAQTTVHVPSSTHLLLGVQQINDLNIKCDLHRRQRRLPLQSYDPDSDFAFDVAPKDVDIKDYGLRVCGDYRQANDQLQKYFPTTANGADELSKLPEHKFYWITDSFSMYNAYALHPCPSRELLAIHTPIGLIEPTRMVFGEMNAGTVACASTPATLMRLPHNAHRCTAAYVDDHAQGSHNFPDLLQGYRDFLALCKEENWTLNATKTRVGYPSCVFSGSKSTTRVHDWQTRTSTPIRRMVPPTNLPELRSTLGVFVQSARFILHYTHIFVALLTALTQSVAGKPVPYLWDDKTQAAYDEVRNLLLDGIHLSPPDYRLPFHGCGDASNDGRSFSLNQYNDLPSNTDFTVTAHSPTETTVQLTQTNRSHTITHNDASRLHIAWWSKCWSDADRKRAPFYLEADTFLWGLAKSRFYALSSPFPLYAYSE